MSAPSPSELRERLDALADRPADEHKEAAIAELVEQADALDDDRLRFDARMTSIEVSFVLNRPAEMFPAFAWCLAAYERQAFPATDRDAADLRWYFKWIVGALLEFPSVPRSQIEAALDDLERFFRAGGQSLRAVHARRCKAARHLGDAEGADLAFDQWRRAERDENSDCAACEPELMHLYLRWRGRDDEALEVADGALVDGLTCETQPHSLLSTMVLPLLEAGRLDEARHAHVRGYRAVRGQRRYVLEIADHLHFLARCGHELRGLDVLRRHVHLLDEPGSPDDELFLAERAAHLLGRLVDEGSGGLTLLRPAAPGRPAHEVTVTDLHRDLLDVVDDRGAAFDARNGNDSRSRLAQEILSAAPVVDHLPLDELAARRAERAADAGGRPVDPAGAPPAPGAPEDPVDPGELAAAADDAYVRGDYVETGRLQRLLEEIPDERLTPRARALRDLGSVRRASHGEHSVGQAQRWLDVIAALTAAGATASATLARAELGRWELVDGRAHEAHGHATGAIDVAAAAGDPLLEARCRTALAIGLVEGDRHDEAEEHLLRARDLVAAADPSSRANVADGLATVCRYGGRPAEAAALHDEVTALRAQVGDEALASLATLRAGQDHEAAEANDEALARYARAAATAPERAREVAAHALLARARLLRRTGADPLADLHDALIAAEDTDDLHLRAEAQTDLAAHHLAIGRPLEAAEAFEELVPTWEELERPIDALQCRSLLATCQARLGELLAAAETLTATVELLGPVAPTERVAEEVVELAQVQRALGRDAEAADRFAQAADLYEAVDDRPSMVTALQGRGRALTDVDEQGARAAFEAAREQALRHLPPEHAAFVDADVDDDVARLLLRHGRREEAIATAERAATAFDALGVNDGAGAARVVLAQLHLQEDDGAAAARTIQLALEQLGDPGEDDDLLVVQRQLLALQELVD